jgi:DNA-binding transcriptional ArsR family regulator
MNSVYYPYASKLRVKINRHAGLRERAHLDSVASMEMKEAIKALGALAQESRLTVFRMLVEAGPEGLTPGVIGERTSIPAATLSFHLKELANAGLVSSRPEGRFILYAPRVDQMAELLDFLTHDCCGGHPELCVPVSVPVPSPKRKVRR